MARQEEPPPKPSRERLFAWAEEGALSPAVLERALYLLGFLPDVRAWRRFVDRLLLGLGVLFVLAGVVFFFAYNWADLGRFAKFGLIEGAILLAVVVAWRQGLDHLIGKVALLVAAVLPGPLLAVYGQVYQTGADAYGLFLTWALLIGPWVLVGRFAPLWLGLIALLNVTLILYWEQVQAGETSGGLYLALFLLNGLALAVAEWRAPVTPWLSRRWMLSLLACTALLWLTMPTLEWISGEGIGGLLLVDVLLYVAFVGFCLWFYRGAGLRDLAVLAACLLSIIVVVTVGLARALPDGFGVYIVLGLLVVAQTAAAAAWLRRVAQGPAGTS